MREASAATPLRPVYLLLGSEGYLASRVLEALRAAAFAGSAAASFNDDRFSAGESSAEAIADAARMAPMMAPRRLVTVRGLERWDAKESAERHPLDVLADYAADPVPSTVMLLCATKLNGSRRLVRAAKKDGFLVACEPLARRELPEWIERDARRLGHALGRGVSDALAELVGPELAPVADALERLSLYVGAGQRIEEDALAAVVTRIRQDDVWALVDALGRRDLGRALAALADAYSGRDGGLPLLGAIGWRVRQLAKVEQALAEGAPPAEAARQAGVPPFKANELERAVKAIGRRKIEAWLLLLAEADVALKGSRRPGERVLETMLIDMCR